MTAGSMPAGAGAVTPACPSLRHRLPLYPSQIIGATIMASLGPLLDSIMTDLGISLSRGGIISAGFFCGGVIGILILNSTMARVPAKFVLVAGMIVQGVGLAVAATASWDLWSLSLAFVLVGFGGGLVNTMCWMWLPAHVKQHLAAAALFMIAFFAVGMIVTPFIIGIAIEEGASWRWILMVEGALSVLAGLVYMALPFLDIPGRRNIRASHLKQIATRNRGLLAGILVAIFMYTGAETVLNVWLPKFHIDVFRAKDTWASFSVTLFWIGLIAGRLVIMPLTKRFSPARLLLICAAVLAVMCVAVAYAPGLTTSLILTVGAGLGASASYGLIGSYAGHFPGWEGGLVTSLFIVWGSVGCVIFPYVFGPLADAVGFRGAMAAVAVPAVIYGLASLLIHSRSQNHPAHHGQGSNMDVRSR